MGQDQSSYAHISLEDKLKFLEEMKSPVINSLPVTYDTKAGLPAAHQQAVETEFALLYGEAKKEASAEEIANFEGTAEVEAPADETPVGATSDEEIPSGEMSEAPSEEIPSEDQDESAAE